MLIPSSHIIYTAIPPPPTNETDLDKECLHTKGFVAQAQEVRRSDLTPKIYLEEGNTQREI
jgi:hypothetical protein